MSLAERKGDRNHSLEAIANSPTSNPNRVLKSTSYKFVLSVHVMSYFVVDFMGIKN